MAEKIKEKKTKSKDTTSKTKKSKKDATTEKSSGLSLLADSNTIDPALSSLFAVKQPLTRPAPTSVTHPPPRSSKRKDEEVAEEKSDDELEVIEGDADDIADVVEEDEDVEVEVEEETAPKRKRRRRDAEEEIEDAYMSRLAREEAKEEAQKAKERAAKRQKVESEATVQAQESGSTKDDEEDEDEDVEIESDDDEDEATYVPPKHETELATDIELSKANRTVFLGNVSTTAIRSKTARKTFIAHLTSFFPSLNTKSTDPVPKIESIRFRSTPYATSIPKKASFAKQELMDATTKSTNAYAIYSTPVLARQAVTHLNGTVILDRHLRVDSVAHPAKTEPRRCVFVGNLGFVDDETNILAANSAAGHETRKPGKVPADVEEGLWRTFGRCGKVESVRVIRDGVTRVGKGIAYVQFEEEMSVGAALLLHEKKFPPMLPRKLRVMRAKAPKRNARPGSERPRVGGGGKPAVKMGYQRKVSGEEASRLGRAGRLLGKAGAAQMRRPERRESGGEKKEGMSVLGRGIKKPEEFIFEGHRATAKSGKSGLKLGGKNNKKKTGASRVTKRSASFKAKKRAT